MPIRREGDPHRDPESWFQSTQGTIFPRDAADTATPFTRCSAR
jgi:hypothetical protein